MAYKEDSNAGKILLAALAGASAGIVAGILLAPDKGSVTYEHWKDSAKDYGQQLGEQYKKYSADLEEKFKNLTGKAEDYAGSLDLKSNWNDIKGKLKQQYAQLSDADLNFDGKVDDLLATLQDKLGKGKSEVVKLLSDLNSKAKDAAGKAKDAYNNA